MPTERRPWDRCKGESHKAFAAFTVYLNLGAERSVQKAWNKAHDIPGQDQNYTIPTLSSHWKVWCAKWSWQSRAEEHDEYMAALEQKARDDIAIRIAEAEAEQQATTRKRMQNQALALLSQAEIILSQCLKVTQAEIHQIILRRQKNTTVVFAGEGKGMTKDEDQTPGALDILELGMKAAEIGQKLYRVSIGEADSITQTKIDETKTIEKMVELMREFVPADKWEDLAERLNALGDEAETKGA